MSSCGFARPLPGPVQHTIHWHSPEACTESTQLLHLCVQCREQQSGIDMLLSSGGAFHACHPSRTSRATPHHQMCPDPRSLGAVCSMAASHDRVPSPLEFGAPSQSVFASARMARHRWAQRERHSHHLHPSQSIKMFYGFRSTKEDTAPQLWPETAEMAHQMGCNGALVRTLQHGGNCVKGAGRDA